MIRRRALSHEFVEFIPDKIEEGVLYVSVAYATAVHACCCGCGSEVVTPLTPTDWSMIFDGDTVSLHPSIGSWNLACRSHYFIRRGRIIEAGSWTKDEIEAERARDRAAKAGYYGELEQPKAANETAALATAKKRGWFASIVAKLKG